MNQDLVPSEAKIIRVQQPAGAREAAVPARGAPELLRVATDAAEHGQLRGILARRKAVMQAVRGTSVVGLTGTCPAASRRAGAVRTRRSVASRVCIWSAPYRTRTTQPRRCF
jgi:hypothetical protein